MCISNFWNLIFWCYDGTILKIFLRKSFKKWNKEKKGLMRRLCSLKFEKYNESTKLLKHTSDFYDTIVWHISVFIYLFGSGMSIYITFVQGYVWNRHLWSNKPIWTCSWPNDDTRSVLNAPIFKVVTNLLVYQSFLLIFEILIDLNKFSIRGSNYIIPPILTINVKINCLLFFWNWSKLRCEKDVLPNIPNYKATSRSRS